MLILTRKTNEAIILTTDDGQEVRLVVLAIKGQQVKIGFEADQSVEIVRAELLSDVA